MSTVGILGLGLIGGSFAKAYHAAGWQVLAYDRDASVLSFAEMSGAVDGVLDAQSVSGCDLVLACICPEAAIASITALAPHIGEKPVVIDCCGTKRVVCDALFPLARQYGFTYLGGHPMAGSERVGYINSKASLLENAYYILTPTPSVPADRLEAYRALVEKLGAIPLILNHEKHDYITAAISHLPHVIAASLVNLVRDSDSEDGIMRLVAAGGFKDITRIASSSAAMWQQICLTNGENISALLQGYIDSLTAIKSEIDSSQADALYTLFDSARIYRDSFINASSGPIKRSFSFNVDIADKSGSLARIVALLANHRLSIKNIGITHNRESEDGVLRIEFYDAAAMETAVSILETTGYSVHLRS